MIPSLRECQILQQLDHKNIMKVKDFFMTNCRISSVNSILVSPYRNDYPELYMVMEYISCLE